MRADVSDPVDQLDADRPRSRRFRRWGAVLLLASAWNVWLWITRVYNLANDPTPRTTEFIVVHAILYVVSFAFAIVIGVIGWRR
ncbi:MAG: hypothetical protein R3320_13515, partial [Nitriliruptorales bacterium]|nr:hypothetical protein [Nitriliruptorales bacterium]